MVESFFAPRLFADKEMWNKVRIIKLCLFYSFSLLVVQRRKKTNPQSDNFVELQTCELDNEILRFMLRMIYSIVMLRR